MITSFLLSNKHLYSGKDKQTIRTLFHVSEHSINVYDINLKIDSKKIGLNRGLLHRQRHTRLPL